ncbi:MAG: hypothetical protein H0W02_20975 [Ktedonobacteraceae bacterium]|nr:hypothetical protein [Ktedonobacteraceae bacterium]
MDNEETIAQAKRLLQLLDAESGMDALMTNVFHGQVQGSTIGNNNTNTFNITNNAPSLENTLAKGRDNAKGVYNALTRRDYEAASRYLEEAVQRIREDQFPQEAAQVKLFQALTLLGEQRPFSITIQTMRRIEQCLRSAIELCPLHSYYYTLALFKRDFARNGLLHSQREAKDLAQQAQQVKRTAIDEDNLKLLAHCQPRLISDSKYC